MGIVFYRVHIIFLTILVYSIVVDMYIVFFYNLLTCKGDVKINFFFQITEELEAVKAQMDERGTNMTDSGIQRTF